MNELYREKKILVRRQNRTNTISVLTNVPKCEMFKESDQVEVVYFKNKIEIRRIVK